MGINLQLLGFQAVPRLAKKIEVKLDGFSGFLDLYGTHWRSFEGFMKGVGEFSSIFLRNSIYHGGMFT